MPELWRVLVVEDDENLNQNIVNALRKDGYAVQGAMSGAEAIRLLWSEEYDVVIGDLKTPGADGLELLQWLRTYCPRTRMIMVAAAGSASLRTQALEGGAAGYLEKPLDLHGLREELRRLLQQTGFSADLDSFDLLDVIQIITMSRKDIALLVDTGLEEQGALYFRGGELVWAEYGVLRGEEAFFALAAHKNGTVIQQPWNAQITPNVTQPLSRLILQALQYREKYAVMQQSTGKQPAINHKPVEQLQSPEPIDDTPFLVLAESQSAALGERAAQADREQVVMVNQETKEWWEQTGKYPANGKGNRQGTEPSVVATPAAPITPVPREQPLATATSIHPSIVRKTPASQRADLPAWVIEQPAEPHMPVHRSSSLSGTTQLPATPAPATNPAEWQPPPSPPMARTTRPLPGKEVSGQGPASGNAVAAPKQPASPEWQPVEAATRLRSLSEPLQSLTQTRDTRSGPISPPGQQKHTPGTTPGSAETRRVSRRNYPALVSALQTLGYSIVGFVAAAVVYLDGQPIAQVALDDRDISPLYKHFSLVLQSTLHALDTEQWGNHEDTVITSADRRILLRLVGSEKDIFLVLITTREADPLESLAVMANVEGAIVAALH